MIVEELIHIIGFRTRAGDAQRVERTIQRLRRRFEELGNTMSMFISSFLTLLSAGIIKTIGEVEQLEVAFSTMLGGIGKAKNLMRELFSFIKETPFEITNAFSAVKQLLAVGFKREGIVEELRMAGDIASGLSVPLKQIIKAYGDVKAKGELQGQELLQFQNAGVALTAELAKLLGKSNDEILKMKEKGLITFANVRDVLKAMTSEGGKFHNMMANQSKTLFGMWSNFMDALTLSALNFRSEWEPILKGLLSKAINFVEALESKLTPALVRVMTIAGSIMAFIGPTILVVLKAKLIAIVGAISAIVGLVSTLIEDVLIWTKGGNSFLEMIIGKKSEVVKAFSVVFSFIDEIKIYASDIFYEFKNLIVAMFNGDDFMINATLDQILSDIINILETVGNMLVKLWESPAFQVFLDNIFDKAKKGLIAYFQFLFSAFARIPAWFYNNVIGKILAMAFNGVKELSKGLVEGLKGDIFTKGLYQLMTSDNGPSKKEIAQLSGRIRAGQGGDVNINANITNQVPVGTTEEQKEAIKKNSESFFSEALRKLSGSVNDNFPILE